MKLNVQTLWEVSYPRLFGDLCECAKRVNKDIYVKKTVLIYPDYSSTQEITLAPYSVSLRVQMGYPGVQVYSYWLP